MKLDLEKIIFKETKDNYKIVQHDNKFLTFWTPKILMPFWVDHEYDKYILKLEFDDKNEEHNHFKKVILHIEKLIKKKIKLEEIASNGIASNGIASNDIASNDIASNDIASNDIASNGLQESDFKEWKSIIKNRPNKSDIIELRIKNFKKNIQTELEFEDKNSNQNYLRTIFDLKKQTHMKALIEINGLWDYRNTENKNQQYKIGLVCYATKLYIYE